MKKVFLTFLLAGALVCAKAGNLNTDTVQLKEKFEQVEKQVKQLQQEVTTLKAANAHQSEEISKLKEVLPAVKQKKLVIDRRGGKQALFQ